MTNEVDLYEGHYGHLATDPQVEVRKETYGEDLGQASWITAAEARRWFDLLQVQPGQTALEVACGSGGVTCALAHYTGAACIGIDINARGIEAAKNRAEEEKLSSLVSFQVSDAGNPLPFPAASFDAVFCNDSINHFPDRRVVLQEWYRLLRSGGRVLFTDPIVVTGQLSNEEIRTRSSIGFFLFTPVGHNDLLLEQTGFTVRNVQDVTDAVVSVSQRWHDARERRRERLILLEGVKVFRAFSSFWMRCVSSLRSGDCRGSCIWRRVTGLSDLASSSRPPEGLVRCARPHIATWCTTRRELGPTSMPCLVFAMCTRA